MTRPLATCHSPTLFVAETIHKRISLVLLPKAKTMCRRLPPTLQLGSKLFLHKCAPLRSQIPARPCCSAQLRLLRRHNFFLLSLVVVLVVVVVVVVVITLGFNSPAGCQSRGANSGQLTMTMMMMMMVMMMVMVFAGTDSSIQLLWSTRYSSRARTSYCSLSSKTARISWVRGE